MSGERGSSHTNLEIGRTLERARAERGLSLWQVEQATKIRARYLHDLERENFDVLPAVYVLGSLKTYADFLGLDGEALVRELKNRQAPQPEERDPMPEEEAPRAEGGLPVVGGREAGEDDERGAPATAPGNGFRLYLGMGTILILALAIALGSILADGGVPAVSQVREPTISEAPSRIAFSDDAQDAADDGRYQDADGTEDQPEKKAESPDEGGEEDKNVGERDHDDTQSEGTGDVAGTLPASIAASASTASASTASASASATATSAPTASASAGASSAAPASAAGTSVAGATAGPSSAAAAPAATAPETAEPNAASRLAVGQPTPGAAGAPAGPRRIVVVDGTRPLGGIVGKVRIVRVR